MLYTRQGNIHRKAFYTHDIVLIRIMPHVGTDVLCVAGDGVGTCSQRCRWLQGMVFWTFGQHWIARHDFLLSVASSANFRQLELTHIYSTWHRFSSYLRNLGSLLRYPMQFSCGSTHSVWTSCICADFVAGPFPSSPWSQTNKQCSTTSRTVQVHDGCGWSWAWKGCAGYENSVK